MSGIERTYACESCGAGFAEPGPRITRPVWCEACDGRILSHRIGSISMAIESFMTAGLPGVQIEALPDGRVGVRFKGRAVGAYREKGHHHFNAEADETHQATLTTASMAALWLCALADWREENIPCRK